MKKLIILSVAIILSLSFTDEGHPFDIVIENQKDHSIKKKLKLFRMQGIEQSLKFTSRKSDTLSVLDSSLAPLPPIVDLEKIITTAKSFLGTRHRMGGTSKKGIDCSGMVMVSLKSAGISVPHNSHEQARYGKIIPNLDSLKRGDLVFFIRSFKCPYLITHSGICVGNNKFIHASVRGGVSITDLNMPYWKSKYIFGTRISD